MLADLERGVSPRRTGQLTAGIGAAMRIAPVALYFDDDPDAMFESVMAASLMTHRDVRSLSGALLVAHAVRRLAAGGPRDPSLLLWIAADVARDEEPIAAGIRRPGHLARSARQEPLAGRRPCRVAARPASRACPGGPGRGGQPPRCRPGLQTPHHGLPPGLHPHLPLHLLTTDSFEEAITEIVNLGGDTDTAGAILGAMAGAHYGPDAHPQTLARRPPEPRRDRGPGRGLARRSTDGLSRSPTWSRPSRS